MEPVLDGLHKVQMKWCLDAWLQLVNHANLETFVHASENPRAVTSDTCGGAQLCLSILTIL